MKGGMERALPGEQSCGFKAVERSPSFHTCIVGVTWPGLGEDAAGPVLMCVIRLARYVPEGGE